MADRRFKNIVELLQQGNCELIRPPSVSFSVKLNNLKIAALRIHVPLVIGTLAKFSVILPHAC